jgi:S-formylglutathione hydrolase FrmB
MAMVYRPWEWVNPPQVPQSGVVHNTYYSTAMQHDVGYNIHLPPGYETSAQRYPVIFWLHGLNNCESTDYFPARYLEEGITAGELPPTILVYPNGWWCGFYSDSSDGKTLSETTIIHELIPSIDRSYRTIATREGRAVQGMSMGGFGACKFAFKYPDLFSSVVAFAPAMVTADAMQARHPEILKMTFGGDPQRLEENAPWTWARTNADRIRGRLPIWIICGMEDGLLPGIQKMDQLLDELQLAHELELIPGIAHNLPALAEAIQRRGFAFAARAFRAAGAPDRSANVSCRDRTS